MSARLFAECSANVCSVLLYSEPGEHEISAVIATAVAHRVLHFEAWRDVDQPTARREVGLLVGAWLRRQAQVAA